MEWFKGKDLHVDLALAMHDLSMSRDKSQACFGRISKHVIPAFHAALEAEHEREMSYNDIILAVINLTGFLLVNSAINIARPGCEAGLALNMLENVGVVVNAHLREPSIAMIAEARAQEEAAL